MNKSNPHRLTRIALVATAIALSLLVAGSYWGWNARNRPSAVSGVWLLDDLRTDGDDASLVVFSPSGVFEDGDRDIATRWQFRNGQLFLRHWKTNKNFSLARKFQDTTAYSWFADVNEFSLRVEFSDDGKVMTLSADGEGPRCRLRRAGR